VLVVTDATAATVEYPIFPIDATTWSAYHAGSYGAEPLDVRVRNRDGGLSAPISYP
jgi:hypothetical protein